MTTYFAFAWVDARSGRSFGVMLQWAKQRISCVYDQREIILMMRSSAVDNAQTSCITCVNGAKEEEAKGNLELAHRLSRTDRKPGDCSSSIGNHDWQQSGCVSRWYHINCYWRRRARSRIHRRTFAMDLANNGRLIYLLAYAVRRSCKTAF